VEAKEKKGLEALVVMAAERIADGDLRIDLLDLN
jgi:hypothetical protein